MANSIVAGNSTNGGTAISTDTSGTLNIVTGSGSGTTAITVDGSQNVAVNGNMSFNSGYGSAAVAYGCRAWVNFNGSGTVAIRSSGNVTSITDNGAGDYTLNITTALPDANYAVVACGENNRIALTNVSRTNTTTAAHILVITVSNVLADSSVVTASVFR